MKNDVIQTICTLILVLAVAVSCDRPADKTEIQFITTIDVLENSSLEEPEFVRDLPVRGFILGYELEDRTVVTQAIGVIQNRTLPAAGSETPPCNDGEKYNPVAVDDPVIHSMGLIADTGAEDVSDDNNCGCDSRIDFIQLRHIEVFYDGYPTPIQYASLQITGDALCPSIPGGHHVRGDREFGGPVDVGGGVVLRVDPVSNRLVVDISLFMVESDIEP
jgi:hypothetical protein